MIYKLLNKNKNLITILFIFSIAVSLINGRAAETSKFDETARFFAGRQIDKNSKLYRFTKSNYYKNYINQLVKGWNKFQKPNLKKIESWWKKYSIRTYSSKILYPFSGPDIMNALTFYPRGKTYIMFGLEKPGIIPAPHDMKPREIVSGLNGLKNSLSTILQYNFFRTKGMKVKLGNKSFNGVAGLITLFLALNDYEVIDAKRVAIDSNSNLVPGIPSDYRIKWETPPKSRRIPGIEILFRKNGGEIKKIKYFMLNVIDYALTTHSPNFIPYIKKEGPYATVIKSASYLMHNDRKKFVKIRTAVLGVSKFIVEDDSGVPLRYFSSDMWKVQLHGYYYQPIPLFRHRTQLDLRMAMKKKSTGKLPFSYGYNFQIGKSNLLTAEKK